MTGISSRPGQALAPLSIALALWAAAMPAEAGSLGRLFFTPERRASLERQRSLTPREIPGAEDSALSLSGVVRRSGGKSTAWINGVPQHDGGLGIRIDLAPREPSGAAISVGGEIPIRLRVGESVNRSTQERKDGLAGGSIVIDGKAP